MLDIAIGCSHNLEFQTEGEWSLSFIKDLRRLAGAVDEGTAAHGQNCEPATTSPATAEANSTHRQLTKDDMSCSLDRLPSFEAFMGGDVEMWSTLLQLPESGDVEELSL